MVAVYLRSAAFAALGLVFAMMTSTSSLAGGWAGKYSTEDTKGNAFSITLAADGSASGMKDGHDMSGTWTDEGDAVAIKWTTGWTTKISKDGDGYAKTAYRPGADSPTGDATAVKRAE